MPKPTVIAQAESEMAGRAWWVDRGRKATTPVDSAGIASPRSSAEAVALARQGVRLVVHRHAVLNVGAAIAKRARRAKTLEALRKQPP
jgi:hypothetical protein